jgi:long-chain acyl-CoA synthetase
VAVPSTFWSTLHSKGDSLAIVDDARGLVLTYDSLHRQVQAVADVLRRYNRSLVLLFAQCDVATIVCYLATLEAGHAVFLAPASMPTATVSALIQTYRPELVFIHPDGAARLSSDDHEVHACSAGHTLLHRRRCTDTPPHQALALVLSTSASTGTPRAVRLSSSALSASAGQVAETLRIGTADRYLLSLPLSYVYGLSVLNSSLHAGGALALIRGTWADSSFCARVAAADVTSVAAVTQTLEYMRALSVTSVAIPTLKRLTHAGGPLDPLLFNWAYENFGAPRVGIYLMYGQTEACGRISVLPPESLPALHRSVGRPMRSSSVSISPQAEVIYRGPGVMLGYAVARKDLELGDILEGVLYTKDCGYLDESGNLFIAGRFSRYCKVFGRRVSLDDVELVFRTESHAVVAAIEKNGIIVVFVEGAGSVASPAPLLEIARRLQLPPQSFCIESIPKLPRTDGGKISYAELRSMVR